MCSCPAEGSRRMTAQRVAAEMLQPNALNHHAQLFKSISRPSSPSAAMNTCTRAVAPQMPSVASTGLVLCQASKNVLLWQSPQRHPGPTLARLLAKGPKHRSVARAAECAAGPRRRRQGRPDRLLRNLAPSTLLHCELTGGTTPACTHGNQRQL